MSRRRKNAGQGYGMMFHGAFSEKKDAVAKEHKTKKAFIRGTPTKHGYRYIVMSPRLNPIKRKKKKTKKEVSSYAPRPGQNPSELLVMGANPGPKEQEIKIPLPGGGEGQLAVSRFVLSTNAAAAASPFEETIAETSATGNTNR